MEAIWNARSDTHLSIRGSEFKSLSEDNHMASHASSRSVKTESVSIHKVESHSVDRLLNRFLEHASLVRVVYLQVPFVGASEVKRRKLFSAGDFFQYSICQSRKELRNHSQADVNRFWAMMPP
jgi:hypothetical protein